MPNRLSLTSTHHIPPKEKINSNLNVTYIKKLIETHIYILIMLGKKMLKNTNREKLSINFLFILKWTKI